MYNCQIITKEIGEGCNMIHMKLFSFVLSIQLVANFFPKLLESIEHEVIQHCMLVTGPLVMDMYVNGDR